MTSALLITSYAYAGLPHTSVEWQVAAYSSAAPDVLGAGATVMAPDGKTVLRAGTNGWTCMASTPGYDATKGWESAAAAAPVCLDAAGFPWLQAYMTGATPTIERDAFVWMLNGDLGFDNSNPAVMTEADAAPGQFVKSGPHLMIMPKDPKTLDLFPTAFVTGEPCTPPLPPERWHPRHTLTQQTAHLL